MYFLLTSLVCLVLIFLNNKYKFGSDCYKLDRKVHHSSTSRLGGLAIYIGFVVSIYYNSSIPSEIYIYLLVPLSFLITLTTIEDLKQGIPPIVRLIFTGFIIAILIYEFDLGVANLNIPILDLFLENYFFSFLFTLLTVLLVTNAFNIIDGFNGLASGFAMFVLIALLWLSINLGDMQVEELSKTLLLVVLSFFVFNFPFGKIFLGDGGAYLLGFLISFLYLYFIEGNSLSYWLALGVLIYPIFDFSYSIYRRFKNSRISSIVEADNLHLHHLIHKNLINCHYFKNKKHFCNSFTSVLLWIFSLTSIIPSVIWYDKPLIIFFVIIVFMLLYHILYVFLSNKKQ